MEFSPIMGLTPVLQALARHPALTKLGLHYCRLGRDEVRLGMALCNIPSLQSLSHQTIPRERRVMELAPALYRNTSIKVPDISKNGLTI
jgi:hypothetical protein